MTEESDFEVTKLQLQQSIDAYKTQMALLVQVCTVFVIADATTIGYAIQQKLAGVIFVGGFFSASVLVSIWHVTQLSIPILSTAISIEMRYPKPGSSGLVSNFVSFRYGSEVVVEIYKATSISRLHERTIALRKLHFPAFPRGGWWIKYLLIFVTLSHAAIPLLLHFYAYWRWFHA